MGWLLAMIGYLGPWISHPTAALSLTGVDIGEFVKFLPGVLGGSVAVTRQAFYVTPFAVVLSVALLALSPRRGYPLGFRILVIAASIPASLQLLPPAWSPSSLLSPEFRLQTLAVALSWLLLASSWWLGRLPTWLTALVSALTSVAALALTIWQFLAVKSSIDQVYVTLSPVGWGFLACTTGLAITALASTALALHARNRSRRSWMTP